MRESAIDQHFPQPRVTAVLIGSSAVAALGGLLFGLDTAVIAGATHALSQLFHLSPGMLGITVSSALWGTIAGAALAPLLGEKSGRRDSLRMAAVLYLVSSLGCAFAWSWPALLAFRIIGGLGIGGSSVLGPMYIAEIAPAAWRGRLVCCFQINIVVGILLAYLSNYAIVLQHFGAAEWRWELGVPALPALIFLLCLFFIPRSPRWLLGRGRAPEAEAALSAIGDPAPRAATARIQTAMRAEAALSGERILSARYRFPLLLAISLGLFCQLSGINAILYYLNDIFRAAGYNNVSGNLQAVAVGATNLVFTLAAMLVIDRIGRKPLLLIGSVAMGSTLTCIAILFATHTHQDWLLWLLIGYAAAFSFSEGAVMWVYIGEIFPDSVRANGLGAGSLAHWIMNALISALFPVFAAYSRAIPFEFFAAMMVLQFLVVWLLFPETKGLALEDVQDRFAFRRGGAVRVAADSSKLG
jgi:MFS transporter, SP family, arabinose:H+ symporter